MLPVAHRLVKRRDWQRVYRLGRMAANREIVLKSAKNNLKVSRFGFSISLKVDKRATRRNKLKRQLRAIIRQNLPDLKPGYDVIMIAKPGLKDNDYASLKDALSQLLKRAKLFI